MRRTIEQSLLVTSILLLSWLGMMIVHEAGHVAGAWATGGTVRRVVLHPLRFSRADVFPNPRPLPVVWAGPVCGVLLPLVFLLAANLSRSRARRPLQFFAGFCLVANGAYIGIGEFERVGDARDLILHGAPPWHLWSFGILCVTAGLWLWHRLGPRFGLSHAKSRSPAAAYSTFALLLIVIAAELASSAIQ